MLVDLTLDDTPKKENVGIDSEQSSLQDTVASKPKPIVIVDLTDEVITINDDDLEDLELDLPLQFVHPNVSNSLIAHHGNNDQCFRSILTTLHLKMENYGALLEMLGVNFSAEENNVTKFTHPYRKLIGAELDVYLGEKTLVIGYQGLKIGFIAKALSSFVSDIYESEMVSFVKGWIVEGVFIEDRVPIEIKLFGPSHYNDPVTKMYSNSEKMMERPPMLEHRYIYHNNSFNESIRPQKHGKEDPDPDPEPPNPYHFVTPSNSTSIYESLLNNAQSLRLPEAEPNKELLVSPLFHHQKQALHFMLEREKEFHPSSLGEGMSCLWREYSKGSYRNILTEAIQSSIPKEARGGIIADDMGLGKTIQVLALIVTGTTNENVVIPDPVKLPEDQIPESLALYPLVPLPLSDHNEESLLFSKSSFSSTKGNYRNKRFELRKPVHVDKDGFIQSNSTLIIAPVSTLSSWESQIRQHLRHENISYYIYHGQDRRKDAKFLSRIDIVITTYSIARADISFIKKRKKSESDPEEAVETADLMKSPLHKIKWNRIVLDEAHVIKSRQTSQYKAVHALHACKRWCLTGTPIQNCMKDLFSLVSFIRFDPFNSFHFWNTFIETPVNQKNPVGFKRLQVLMNHITLRRTKTQEVNGKRIVDLPKRENYYCLLTMNDEERQVYDKAICFAKEMLKKMKTKKKLESGDMNALLHILHLRQTCSHLKLLKNGEFLSPVQQEPNVVQLLKIYLLLKDIGELDKCTCCATSIDEDGEEEDGVITRCAHIFCMSCWYKLVKSGNQIIDCPSCLVPIKKDEFEKVSSLKQRQNNIIQPASVEKPFQISENYKSTKVEALLKDLRKISQENSKLASDIKPVKCLIFSQWTQFLNLIEVDLKDSGIQFTRLDGEMVRSERNRNLELFRTNDELNVLLVSLKAGGVGLTLTCASRVYVMEPYWNPAVEEQAIDRVHRLGQTRDVQTIRFLIKDSIEERIVKLQEFKKELASKSFASSSSQKDAKFQNRMEELIYLLQ